MISLSRLSRKVQFPRAVTRLAIPSIPPLRSSTPFPITIIYSAVCHSRSYSKPNGPPPPLPKFWLAPGSWIDMEERVQFTMWKDPSCTREEAIERVRSSFEEARRTVFIRDMMIYSGMLLMHLMLVYDILKRWSKIKSREVGSWQKRLKRLKKFSKGNDNRKGGR